MTYQKKAGCMLLCLVNGGIDWLAAVARAAC